MIDVTLLSLVRGTNLMDFQIMSQQRGLNQLDDFIDSINMFFRVFSYFRVALTAIPQECQRVLTMLREQDAISSRHETAFHELVDKFIDGAQTGAVNSENLKASLMEMQAKLFEAMEASRTKVNLAKYMRQMTEASVKQLEDEVCMFEEEVRLARTYGDFDDGEDEEAEEEALAAIKAAAKRKKTSTSMAPFARKSSEEPLEISRGNSPKMASSPADFDKVPSEPPVYASTGTSKKAHRSNNNNVSESVIKSPIVSPDAGATSPTAAAGAASSSEPTYCYCNQVSFGEMIGCDNPDCPIEWFHYGCVGLEAPPAGKWYCLDCTDAVNSGVNAVLPPTEASSRHSK